MVCLKDFYHRFAIKQYQIKKVVYCVPHLRLTQNHHQSFPGDNHSPSNYNNNNFIAFVQRFTNFMINQSITSHKGYESQHELYRYFNSFSPLLLLKDRRIETIKGKLYTSFLRNYRQRG